MKLQFLLYFFIASAGISVSSYYYFYNAQDDTKIIVNKENRDNLKSQEDFHTIVEEKKLEKKLIKDPLIEVFRVEPDGQFVIAGSGEPLSKIFLKENDYILQFTNVDKDGKWVMVSQKRLSEGDHLLILEQQNEDGIFILSKDIFVAKIYDNKQSKPMVFNLPNEDGGKLEIIQKQSKNNSLSNKENNEINLTTKGSLEKNIKFRVLGIEFDDIGKLSIYGKAKTGISVQAVIDNKIILETKIDNNNWEINTNSSLEYGLHSLDLILLDLNKINIANLKFPFVRKEFKQNLLQDDFIVIEPGDMLWKIAYKVYGDGWKYIEIFDNNKEQISNPDLIFPGQIFLLPKN